MALGIDCLHNIGTLFSVKHLLRISNCQLCNVGPYLAVLSMPATFLLLGTAILSCILLQRRVTPASPTQLHLYVAQST